MLLECFAHPFSGSVVMNMKLTLKAQNINCGYMEVCITTEEVEKKVKAED